MLVVNPLSKLTMCVNVVMVQLASSMGCLHHLLPWRRAPPGAGFTCTVGQPVNPVGFEVARFHPAQPAVPVHFGHNAGADQIGDKAHDFCELCVHIINLSERIGEMN